MALPQGNKATALRDERRVTEVRFPEHVTGMEPEHWYHLQFPELRVFLASVGIPLTSQPQDASRDTLIGLIQMQVNKDTVLAQYVYEIIVLHKAPTGYDPAKSAWQSPNVLPGMEALFTRLANDYSAGMTMAAAREARKEAEKAMRLFLSEQMEVHRPVSVQIADVQRKVTGKPHAAFGRVCQLAANGKNVALVGPSGCGKTFLAEQVAEGLGRKFAAQSMSAGVSESAFIGTLLPTGQGGEFAHVPTPFLDVYENGGVFLFDEMDNADANLLVFLNMALSNRGFFLPIRKGSARVTRHPEFVALAAMNTYGHGGDIRYVGRSQLDAATLDRFRIGTVFMDYDKDLESSLGDSKLVSWAAEVRAHIAKNGLNRICSTRTIIDGTDMMAAGWKLVDVKEAYFADWTADEKRGL